MENTNSKKFSRQFLWFKYDITRTSVGFSGIRWSKVTWWFILSFCIFKCYTDRFPNNNWQNTLGSDGIGYYSYLPATFIYHDYSYLFTTRLAEKYPQIRVASTQGFCNTFNGKRVNKYFAGEAVAIMPFFLVAHWLSGSEENPADGFAFYYMAAVSFAAIFYLMLGLWALRALLLRFGVKDGHVTLVLLVLFFGTNLSRYTLGDEAMSHIYSFGFISCFVLQAHKLFEKFTTRGFLVLAFLFAFIVLLRPINFAIIFCLPFLAGNVPTLKLFFQEIFKRPLVLCAGIVIGFLIIFIQMGMYYEQCQKWFVYAYSKEGFNFAHPHFFSCLFSYSNGLFVYAPVLFIAMFGVFTFLPKEKFRFFSFLIFFTIVVWLISSWWAWTYGGAFGMRPLIEYYIFFALLLGLLLRTISRKRFAVLAMSVLFFLPFIVLYQIQIWQFRYGIIGYDQMTKENYWFVFLETRRQFYYVNVEDKIPPVPEDAHLIYSYFNDYERRDSIMDWRSVTTEKAFSGTHSICLKTGNNHAPNWRKRMGDLIPDSLIQNGKFIATGNTKWFTEDNGTDSRMVLFLVRKGKIFYYNEMYIIHQVREENKWSDFKWNLELPQFEANDSLVIFPRRDNWFPVYIDDLKVDLYKK